MSRPTIAIDIDDVLSANAAGFVAFSNQRWGTHLTVEDYSEHFADMWQTDVDETERRALEVHYSGVFGTYDHDQTAKPVLQHIAQHYRLVIVTSRRRILEVETFAWLRQYFEGIFDDVHFAGMWDKPNKESIKATKAEVLKVIGAQYLIDDQLKHCEAAALGGAQAILFGDYTWNQAQELPEGVTRCKNWAAVQEYFDGRS